ncbi:MAG TPA: nitrilase-related carbon-nitrogen hydrolase [Shinella sp.]|jgi:predicted amidohydrolase|uniref:nitrilase-related carbon-nitrogen hydrolase n=1 Tax=Shinella sp. TaxID=1870904 RepID=UPI002E12491A|nr:nitrilase-related carbon-nitrogen hydrolase [Shinella sp.]
MKISIGQITVTPDKARNIASICSAVEAASKEGASLIIFPEFAMLFDMADPAAGLRAAETIPGEFTRTIDTFARTFGIVIAVGMHEAAGDGTKAYNTIYVTSGAGNEIAKYRKVHLMEGFGLRESDTISPSPDPDAVVFHCAELCFGIITCYDVRFPESARALADVGVDVILLPSFWATGPQKLDHWTTLIKARAIENTAYVVASNSSAPGSFGTSMIVDPSGNVLASLGAESETRTVDISKAKVDQIRQQNPSLSCRRFRVVRI